MSGKTNRSGADLSASDVEDELGEPDAGLHGILMHSSQVLRFEPVAGRYNVSNSYLELLALSTDRQNAEIPTEDLIYIGNQVEAYPGEPLEHAQFRIEAATLILKDRGIEFKPRKN